MKQAFWENSLWYNDWVSIVDSLALSDVYCKITWLINNIEVENHIYSECISHYKIWILSFNNKTQYIAKSMWVKKWDEWIQCWEKIWLYSLSNYDSHELWSKRDYNPQIWDYIVMKLNNENSYISMIYPQDWRSIDQVDTFFQTINLPICTWSLVSWWYYENQQLSWHQIYSIWITILLGIVICFLCMRYFKKSSSVKN